MTILDFISAPSLVLPPLKGSAQDITRAEPLRKKVAVMLWEGEWHETLELLQEDIDKLPLEASWWIEHKHKAFSEVEGILGLDANA